MTGYNLVISFLYIQSIDVLVGAPGSGKRVLEMIIVFLRKTINDTGPKNGV